jgi:AhpD family alkylhydroperoxidase
MTTTRSTAGPRVALSERVPDLYKAMLRFDAATQRAGIEPRLHDLIRLRASQLNGCVYCIDMHTKDARDAGESERRLYALTAWRESDLFSARERAALALTEAVTLLSESHVPDDVWEEARAEFDEDELAGLVFAATVINAWNRLAVSARMVPDSWDG